MKSICITIAALVLLITAAESRAEFATPIQLPIERAALTRLAMLDTSQTLAGGSLNISSTKGELTLTHKRILSNSLQHSGRLVSTGGSIQISAAPSEPAVNQLITGGITIRPVKPIYTLKEIAIPAMNPGSPYFFLDAGDENGSMIGMSTAYSPQVVGSQTRIVASELVPAQAPAPVPLPPALFLMGSGIAGLLGIRRRIGNCG